MKKLAIALLTSSALITAVAAQTVQRQPGYLAPNAWTDLGNGPTEVLVIEGSGSFYTAQGSGVGQTTGGAAGTGITLTATPAVPPCVGCLLSGAANPSLTTTTIPAGAYVSAYNGTTVITMSTNVTIGTGATLSWGAACPTSGAPPAPNIGALGAPILIRGSAGAVDYGVPFYTQSRVCGYGGFQPGTFVNFAIGAH